MFIKSNSIFISILIAGSFTGAVLAGDTGDHDQDHGTELQGMDHSKMQGMDHNEMQGMDHNEMQGMDHNEMQGMDHNEMQGMDHSKMQGMDHNEMQGMNHHADSEGSKVGHPATEQMITKGIHVIARDTMRFEFLPPPDLINGDVVDFFVTNQGEVPHEFSIGNRAEQEAHREMMRRMPGMIHADGNIVTVQPGETKELIWQFKGGDEVEFACNIPGHYEAGMFERVQIQSLQAHQD